MYYPPSQIQTDLFTKGEEYLDAVNETPYTGFYFKTSDGRKFTGRNPNNKPNRELIDITPSSNKDVESLDVGALSPTANNYDLPPIYLEKNAVGINKRSVPPKNPTQIYPIPSESDYELGEFQRYFCKRRQSPLYVEVSLEEFDKFKSQENNVNWRKYLPFSIPWIITGVKNEVIKINKKTVERVQRNYKISGFKSYFKEKYDQFFQYRPGENLNTDGTEFINQRTGRKYRGPYHVHPDKGPMVGAQHVPFSHDYLLPLSGSTNQETKSKAVSRINTVRSTGYSGGY